MTSPDATGRADLNGRPPVTHIYLREDKGTITHASFETFGCAVSVASCSVLTDLIKGRTVQFCLDISPADIENALEGVPSDRRFCADLAIQALRCALIQLMKGGEDV